MALTRLGDIPHFMECVARVPSNLIHTIRMRRSKSWGVEPPPLPGSYLQLMAMEGDAELVAFVHPRFEGPEFEAMLGLPGTIHTRLGFAREDVTEEFGELRCVAGIKEARSIATMVEADFERVKFAGGEPAGKMPPFEKTRRNVVVAHLDVDIVPDWDGGRVDVRIKLGGFGAESCRPLYGSVFLGAIRKFADARSIDVRGTVL